MITNPEKNTLQKSHIEKMPSAIFIVLLLIKNIAEKKATKVTKILIKKSSI